MVLADRRRQEEDGREETTLPREPDMSVNCDVILQWSATPEQLRALGTALWRWCTRAAEATGIYQYLDNQALVDLIAGKLPASSQGLGQADGEGIHFMVWDESSDDRQATIQSLRWAISANGVKDILVAGKSWNVIA
jgi:hypothetical protein